MTHVDPANRSLLVIGWSKVGKTVLAVQLVLRTQKGKGSLTFREPPPNLTLVEAPTAALSEGRAPAHTPANVLSDLTLPLTGPFDLVWPDYGGEQVRKMVGQKRRLPQGWRERVESAGGWLLMIRPMRSPDFEDVLTRPLPEIVTERRAVASTTSGTGRETDADGEEYDPSSIWSDQSLLIEILQILREVRGRSAFDPETAPVLAVALSCWDEMYPDAESDRTPSDVLRKRYPLLTSFVEANWAADRRVVYGISAQGQDLKEGVSDEAYAEKGPEEHGYIVDPSGERDTDLTVLISDVIERIGT